MNEQHRIAQEVLRAKKDNRFCDKFIKKYIPFVKAEVTKFLKRPVDESTDDEFSIGMLAFYEAIKGYRKDRGAFLAYASLTIRSRLLDNMRKERKHSGVMSLDAASCDDDEPVINSLADPNDKYAEYELSLATKEEIEELKYNLEKFGVSLSDVADNCPKQKKTFEACKTALEFAKKDKKIFEDFLRTGRLPIAVISKGCGVERKTLERHRKYLVALFLIHTNGYEIIRGHIKHIAGGVKR